MTTLTDIAADIRRVSPGALPESILVLHEKLYLEAKGLLPDDIAEAVLRDAMVRDGPLKRWAGDGWAFQRGVDDYITFPDSDYGGSLQACHAAWRWAKGLDQLR